MNFQRYIYISDIAALGKSTNVITWSSKKTYLPVIFLPAYNLEDKEDDNTNVNVRCTTSMDIRLAK